MKKTGVRVLVLVLAGVMLLSVLMPAMSTLAGAVTKGDIQDIENSLADVEEQKKEVEAKLEAIEGDMAVTEEKIQLLQDQILLTEQQIYESQKLLDGYDEQIQTKEAEIAQLEAQEAAQYQEFYAQTRWLEETGSASYLSILFQASSFSELLDYMMLVTDIMRYNDRIITQLEQTQAQLAQARSEIQIARDGQAATQARLETSKAQLGQQKADTDAYYQQLLSQESSYNSEVTQLAADMQEIESELKKAQQMYEEEQRRLQEQAAANNNNNNGGGASGGSSLPVVDPTGTWYWPLPGRYYISSVFGGRYSPITGKWETHLGADVPAPNGTPIQAANGGLVTTAKHNGSYGNYCIIYHGNGYATLYAHMSSLAVSAGQTVSAGQVIGYVGSTGDSTGNHLHFELHINGQRANALDLYPNLNFTGL